MSFIKYILVGYLSCFVAAGCWARDQSVPGFTVYAFIPWKRDATHVNKKNELSTLLLKYGIHPVYVIYENKYFTDKKIDRKKIKKIALETAKFSQIPVSFDMEFGNRFKPETVIPDIKTILTYFRHYNSRSLIGIYATIPQNTYGKKPEDFSYEQLNNQYHALVDWVDFISPSLYNYEQNDFNTWLDNATLTIKTARRYSLSKPIIPYISPIIRLGSFSKVKNGNLVEELSEQEMANRLDSLYELGASGCIIWASSQDRKQNGEFPQFNPKYGWGKAVVTFIKLHEIKVEEQ